MRAFSLLRFLFEKRVDAMGKRENFPKGVIYILWNIFFDRFSSGGFLGENQVETLIYSNLSQFFYSQ
jgi:hypothetical protein